MPTPSPLSKTIQKKALSYIRPHHREIARRLILGQTQNEICEYLGMSPSRMSVIVNSPLFKLELSRLERERDKGAIDISRQLKQLAPIALEQIERTMYKAGGRLAFDAARDILDRAGYGKINKLAVQSQVDINVENMQDSELIKLLKQRIIKRAADVSQQEEEIAEVERTEIKFEALDYDHDHDHE